MFIDFNSKLDSFFISWLLDDNVSKIFSAIEDCANKFEIGQQPKFDFSIFTNASPKKKRLHYRPPISSYHSLHKIPTDILIPQKSLPYFESDNAYIPHFYKTPDALISASDFHSNEMTTGEISHILIERCQLPKAFAPIILKNYTLLEFVSFFNQSLAGHDPNECFFNLVKKSDKVEKKNLIIYAEAIVNTHESLAFLENEPQFRTLFIDFIITRCFFIMDTELLVMLL